MKTPDTVEGLGREGYFLDQKGFIGSLLSVEKITQLGLKLTNFSREDIKNFFDPKKKNTKAKIRFPESEWKSLIFQLPNYFNDDFKFTKDNLATYRMGVAFQKTFIHFPLFRDEFQKLFESGIFKKNGLNPYGDYNSKKANNPFKIVEQEMETKVLSMEDLKSEFIIWLVTVLIAVVVFICEKIYFRISNKIKEKKQKKMKNCANLEEVVKGIDQV